jgi:predicted methyltransferase
VPTHLMTVVELSPGSGWYTEILAPYLHDNGKLIAAGAAFDPVKPPQWPSGRSWTHDKYQAIDKSDRMTLKFVKR